MSAHQVFILISVFVTIIIIGLFVMMLIRRRRSGNQQSNTLTSLTSAAVICVIIGITFGEERWIGYGFIGLGMLLAIIDMLTQLKK